MSLTSPETPGFNGLRGVEYTGPRPTGPETQKAGEGGFAKALGEALTQVNDLQVQADATVEKIATGEVKDVHQAMVAFEQARLSMQMLVEVRNKLVEAYQEVARMPI